MWRSPPPTVTCMSCAIRWAARRGPPADLTAVTAAPPAAVPGPLASWVNASDQHVVYRSADGHVHELYSAPGTEQWAAADLTAATSAPPATPANPLGSW